MNTFESIDIFHFCSCAEFITADRFNRNIDIRSQRTLLHLTVRRTYKLKNFTQFFNILNRFISRLNVGFGNDFQKRNTTTVIVNKSTIAVCVVYKFTCVFFHVNFFYSDLFHSAFGRMNFNISVLTNRQIKLRNLIRFRQIGIKIVFTVKFIVLCYFTIRSKSCSYGIFHYFFIYNRKRARHTRTDFTNMSVRFAAEFSCARTKDFCFC